MNLYFQHLSSMIHTAAAMLLGLICSSLVAKLRLLAHRQAPFRHVPRPAYDPVVATLNLMYMPLWSLSAVLFQLSSAVFHTLKVHLDLPLLSQLLNLSGSPCDVIASYQLFAVKHGEVTFWVPTQTCTLNVKILSVGKVTPSDSQRIKTNLIEVAIGDHRRGCNTP